MEEGTGCGRGQMGQRTSGNLICLVSTVLLWKCTRRSYQYSVFIHMQTVIALNDSIDQSWSSVHIIIWNNVKSNVRNLCT